MNVPWPATLTLKVLRRFFKLPIVIVGNDDGWNFKWMGYNHAD